MLQCMLVVKGSHVSCRTPTLYVAEDNYFNLSIKLSNRGDDSYNTSLMMYYPPGLSFSRLTLTQVQVFTSQHLLT